MTPFRPLAALVTVFALAGCASATTTTSPGAPSPTSVAASSVAATPKAQAMREAKRILTAFRAPAGARLLSGAPAGVSLLSSPGPSPSTPNRVDQVEWWTTTGDPATVAQSIATPAGAAGAGGSRSSGPGGSTYGVGFAWPATSVLDERQLQVGAESVGNRTILRADAIVTWLPVRPADSIVPRAAKAVTVSYTAGMNDGVSVGPLTSTNPRIVAGIIAAVNDQPMRQLGEYHCPMSRGAGMTVVFADHRGGPAIAKAVVGADGCTVVNVSVTGGGSATLVDGATVIQKIAELMSIKQTSVTPQMGH